MNPLAVLSAVRWLVRDTFRQSRASGAFWLMLAVILACTAVCLTAKPVAGGLELAFGAMRIPAEGSSDAVRILELYLAGGVADVFGLLLALVWTASLLPSFLEARSSAVLLAKPLPRWGLLAGKYLGVLAFVAVQDGLFIGGTWIALGLRTGIWDTAYLLCLPLLLLHFAVFFSFSAMLATATRSTAACAFGSVLFWLLCGAMNLGRHCFMTLPDLQGAAAGLGHAVEWGYWILPKPLDFHLILTGTLGEGQAFSRAFDMGALTERGAWQPLTSVLASCVCGLVLLALAAYDFVTAEY